MNRLYVPAIAFLMIGGSAVAQHAMNAREDGRALKQRHFPVHEVSSPILYSGDRDVIWSDDFSSAGNWTLGDVDDPNNEHWTIGTAGPTGPFSSSYGPIVSTSAANGYALFDSDALCGGTQNAWVQVASPIDLSAHAGAVLQFEQFFTRFRGDTYVDISTNGTDWTEIEVNDAVAVNASTPNPELTSLNISAQAGGQSTVWIRFRYYSVVGVHGNDAGCDYAWMVDDVAIVTLPDNEIRMDFGFTSHTGNGEEYGRIPSSQLPATMNVGAGVFNFGGMDQTNVVVNMSVLNESLVEVATASDPMGTILSQGADTMDQDVTLPALPVGLYTVNFTVTSDQTGSDADPANNTAVRTFRITDDLYSLDGIGDHPDGTEILTQAGTGSFADNTENVKFLTYYPIISAVEVTGIQVELGPLTEAGSFLNVTVHDSTDVQDQDFTQYFAESDFHTITNADIAAGVINIPFLDPVTLSPGAYYAAASLFQDATVPANPKDLYLLDDETVPQPINASLLFTPVDPNGIFLYNLNGVAWAVRLSSDATIGMSETDELTGVSMYPNPTSGLLNIASEHAGNHMVAVINVLGEVVLTTNFIQNTRIDLGAFANGVYSVRIANESGSTVQRITLN